MMPFPLLLLLLLLLPSPVVLVTAQNEGETAAAAEGYVLYRLPPFTVSLTSNYTLGGLPVDPLERGTLLASSLHQPLKIITSEFLLESFRLDLARQPRSYQNQSTSMRSFLDTFMTLDLQVAVKAVEYLDITTGASGSTIDSSNSNNNRRRRRELQTEQDPLENLPQGTVNGQQQPSKNNNNNVLQFQADFFTTAAFVIEPSTVVEQPTNQEVSAVLEVWMENAFSQDKPYYYDLLVNSPNSVLEHLQQLYIETDSGAVFDPSTTGTMPTDTTQNNNNGAEDGTSPTITNTEETHVTAHSWTPKEKLFFTILVCVAAVSIAGLLFAVSHHHAKKGERRGSATSSSSNHNNLSSHHNYNYNTNRRHYNDYDDEEECIGGRHADEIMEVLQASDRYLANYRPDLLAKYGDASDQQQQQHEPIIPVAATENASSMIERRYVTPSNPFQYLYGASYFHRERLAVERDQAQKRQHRQAPMDNVELEQVPDDEPTEQVVSRYLQSWFQRVVMRRVSGTTEHQQQQESFHADDHLDTDQQPHDTVADEYGDMACNEDPSQYDFAFSDFPRNDGTPCLIYEETLNEEEEEQYLSQQQRLNYSTSSFGITDENYLMTDDEFQRALRSGNNSDTSHILTNTYNSSSINSHADNDDDDDAAALQDILKETSNHNGSVPQEQGPEDDPAQFTNKLERLVAMRHRHYEKQRIVEKHREQRRQERAKQRASQQHEEMQKRDRLLRRHCLELEIQELEATLAISGANKKKTPMSITTKGPTTPIVSSDGASTKTSDQQTLRSLQKPDLHRRTSSEADASGVVGVHSPPPSSGIKSNRSMDMDDAYNKKTTIGTTTTDFMKENNGRMVQSARKQSRPLGMTNSNVFRTIDIATTTGSTINNTNTTNLGVVSPTRSSMTETGSTASPSSSTGDLSNSSLSSSIRDGSRARKALVHGFKVRRSMSFGNLEEKKTYDGRIMSTIDGGGASSRKRPLVPRQQQQHGQQQQQQQPKRSHSVTRSNSIGGHRRTSSNSTTEDLSVHGIYAQFV